MTYRVVVLARATRDIERCYLYIRSRSPAGAKSWFNRLAESKSLLARDPLSRALAYENQFVEYPVREFVFGTKQGLPYRMLYTVVDREVRILRVRGPGQDFVQQQDL